MTGLENYGRVEGQRWSHRSFPVLKSCHFAFKNVYKTIILIVS